MNSVDTAVVGQLSNPVFIGGVAIGGTIFNTMYWILGFLRVSTSGYSAKAYGKKDSEEEILSLVRPFIISLAIGLIFIIFQNVILNLAIHFYKPTKEIMHYMTIYYKILIWGAPFVLLNYTCLGWIMGRKYIKECLLLQLVTNLINIVLDIYFVKKLNMNVGGVALATLISQIFTTLISLIIILKGRKNEIKIGKEILKIKFNKVFDKSSMKDIGSVNSDLVIRTICLLTATNLFVEKGAGFGELVLAGNAILFQIQYLMSYLFDGFANASSVFMGNGVGEKNETKIRWTIQKTTKISIYTGIILATLFKFFGLNLIKLYSKNPEVIEVAHKYSFWLIVYPLVVHVGLTYYGLFTGATSTKFVKNSMLQALSLFFISFFLIIPKFGNNGVWFSFILFSLGRSLFLIRYIPKLKEKVFKEIYQS